MNAGMLFCGGAQNAIRHSPFGAERQIEVKESWNMKTKLIYWCARRRRVANKSASNSKFKAFYSKSQIANKARKMLILLADCIIASSPDLSAELLALATMLGTTKHRKHKKSFHFHQSRLFCCFFRSIIQWWWRLCGGEEGKKGENLHNIYTAQRRRKMICLMLLCLGARKKSWFEEHIFIFFR